MSDWKLYKAKATITVVLLAKEDTSPEEVQRLAREAVIEEVEHNGELISPRVLEMKNDTPPAGWNTSCLVYGEHEEDVEFSKALRLSGLGPRDYYEELKE